MSRMFDRMLAQGFAPPWWMNPDFNQEFRRYRTEVLDVLKTAQVFHIDNVADYTYSGIERETWELSEFPNLAPPFPALFMETRSPRRKLTKVEGRYELVPSGLEFVGWGVMVIGADTSRLEPYAAHSTPRPPTDSGIANIQPARESFQSPDGLDGRHPKWRLRTLLFVEPHRGDVFGPAVTWEFEVDAEGAFFRGPRVLGAETPPGLTESEYYDFLAGYWGSFFYPALLSISFLHCKNVQVARQTPPRKLSHAFQRRHGRALTQFHTLQITPMRKVLEREGQSQTLGLKKALHICRGHFKTFTLDRKLFGRYAGTYWWDAHVRGAMEHGIALKDYQVNQPAEASRVVSPAVSLAL